jgi:glycine/D-amino acid oxidase-like deaminating enzyme
MTIKKEYHVVVIGSGITGLSTALHLKRLGISQIAMAQGNTLGSPSRLASGFCSGGHLDNFNRLSHLHGMKLANDLWTYGHNAFDFLKRYSIDHRVAFKEGHRLRLITSSSELTEAREATAQLATLGLEGSLILQKPDSLHERILALQDDGFRGGFWISEALLSSLSTITANIHRIPAVKEIVHAPDGIRLILTDGMAIRTEVAVVAAHTNTGQLVPELAPALVPFVDQWSEFYFEKKTLPRWCIPGTTFSANHTHEWGVVISDRSLRYGGGRYLRHMAGVECTHAHVVPDIIKHLEQQLTRTFTSITPESISVTSTYGMVDIKPCDELPIIGPMFGEPRLLIATGFGGQGPHMGLYAGAQIANLIAEGAAPNLPRALWPERLRALPENT